jgi:glutathione S-transferase
MAQVVFRSMPDSAYLWTAMHVADEKGISYELVPLEYRSTDHLKLHPFGKMPVMQHGSFTLYETTAIAHYLDRAFPGPALQPIGARAQAEMLRWISIVNSYVFPIMNRFTKERLVKEAWGFEPDQAFIASAREPLALQLRLIDDAVTATKFIAGNAITLADSFLLPHLLFFSITPEGTALLAEKPATVSWLARMRERPSFRANMMSNAFTAMLAGAKEKQKAVA